MSSLHVSPSPVADRSSNKTLKQFLPYAGLALGILLLGLLCFFHLNYAALNDWDEARHGVSAYEMLREGEPIVSTWEYAPDYWNLKPPLSEWLIMLGYKIFGFNAWGLRFYSALSMFLTGLLCTGYVWRRSGKTEAVFALFAFCSFGQLFFWHCARHGDADALYILFYTGAVLCLCESLRNFRWTYGACLCFSFAFLAKSWHAGTIAILVLLTLLFTGAFRRMKLHQYLLCAISALFPLGCWAATRYAKDGMKFFTTMISYDLVDRTSQTLEGHSGGLVFYFRVLYQNIDHGILLLLIVVAVVGLMQLFRTQHIRIPEFCHSELFVTALSVAIPVVLFTFAKTKLAWYISCIYPALALFSAFAFRWVREHQPKDFQVGALIIAFAALISCSVMNVREVVRIPSQSSTALTALLADGTHYNRARFYIANPDNYAWNGSNWTQAQVMESEWLADCTPQSGGIDAFESDSGSYLIFANSRAEDLSAYELVCQTEAYSLYFNP